ncbi:MAG: hypothetical protein ABII02_01475 [Candidatus Magasanikbacteria bacterium]
MIMKPPHLPRKIHSAGYRRRGDFIIWFIACAIIGFLAGITATLVSVAWIVPVYSPNTVVYSVDMSRKSQEDHEVDQLFVQQLGKQIVNIYDSREKNAKGFYTPEGYLGPGVFLTSDGWLVFHYPEYSIGLNHVLEIVDHKGNVFDATEVVFDPLTNLLYVKAGGDGFVSATFATRDATKEGTFLWSIFSDDWSPSALGHLNKNKESGEHAIWEPQFSYELPNVTEGSILIQSDGSFVGFASDDEVLIPSFFVENQYRSVFESSRIVYRGLNLQGYLVDGTTGADGWIDIIGFYVSKSPKRPSENTIGVGDLITHIEGLPVNGKVLFEYILSSGDNLSLSVLRNGQKIDILTSKEDILLR